jgi:hypothetical protein
MMTLGSSISLILHLLKMLVIIYDRHMFIVQATGHSVNKGVLTVIGIFILQKWWLYKPTYLTSEKGGLSILLLFVVVFE